MQIEFDLVIFIILRAARNANDFFFHFSRVARHDWQEFRLVEIFGWLSPWLDPTPKVQLQLKIVQLQFQLQLRLLS